MPPSPTTNARSITKECIHVCQSGPRQAFPQKSRRYPLWGPISRRSKSLPIFGIAGPKSFLLTKNYFHSSVICEQSRVLSCLQYAGKNLSRGPQMSPRSNRFRGPAKANRSRSTNRMCYAWKALIRQRSEVFNIAARDHIERSPQTEWFYIVK